MSDLSRLAARFQALADPTRLALVRFIATGEPTASDCVRQMEQSQPRIARHLRVLVEAGIIVARRDGRFVYYTLAAEGVGQVLAQAASAALAAGEAESVGALRPGPAARPLPVSAERIASPGAGPPVPAPAPPRAESSPAGPSAISPSPALERPVEPADPPPRPAMEDFLL